MQIMPDTASWITDKTDDIEEGPLDDPERNIALGTWYLSWLSKKYESDVVALAAYNSGDKNIDNWLKINGDLSDDEFVKRIPFKETREYVTRVKNSRSMYKKLYQEEF